MKIISFDWLLLLSLNTLLSYRDNLFLLSNDISEILKKNNCLTTSFLRRLFSFFLIFLLSLHIIRIEEEEKKEDGTILLFCIHTFAWPYAYPRTVNRRSIAVFFFSPPLFILVLFFSGISDIRVYCCDRAKPEKKETSSSLLGLVCMSEDTQVLFDV